MYFIQPRQRDATRGDTEQHIGPKLGQQQSERPARNRKDGAFREKRPDDVPASSAQSSADGHFTGSCGGACQHQVRNIGACDQQHQYDSSH